MGNIWKVVSIKPVKAKKVIAYLTVSYGVFEFRNLRVLGTSQGLVALFPGYAQGRISIPFTRILSETIRHQLQETVRVALIDLNPMQSHED